MLPNAFRGVSCDRLDDSRALMSTFAHHYNNERLHSALGYVTPDDKLAGRETEIWASRDARLEAARELRRQRRKAAAAA